MPGHKRNGDVETDGRLDDSDNSSAPNNRTQADLERHSRDFTDLAAEDAPSTYIASYEEERRAEIFADQWRETKIQESFVPRGPRGYRRSDSSIRDDITECLNQHGQIDAGRIQVTVEDGEVTLTGTVGAREEKRLAEIMAEQCAGVKVVCNELRVHHPDSGREDNQSEPPKEAPRSAARAN